MRYLSYNYFTDEIFCAIKRNERRCFALKKRLIALFTTFIICCGFLPAFADGIAVIMDGKTIDFDTPPRIINDRTMVPVRAVFEAFGASVSWDDITKTVTANKSDTEIILRIGDSAALVNGNETGLDCAPQIADGRTLVPLRFIGEALGSRVEWDNESKTVIITSKNKSDVAQAVPGLEIKAFSASSDDGNKPENVFDGNYGTRWSAEGQGEWFLIELPEVTPVGYMGIAFYQGDERSSFFRIYTSVDGVDFEKKVDTMYGGSLNMGAFDLGGDAVKYIKFEGLGNSTGLWNSVTEMKIFPPTADGSMPVEKFVEEKDEIPADIKEKLDSFDKLYEKSFAWLASLYDSESGGFYATRSGRDSKDMKPGLEMTSWAITILSEYSGVWTQIPEEIRLKMLDFYRQRYDKKTGFYTEPDTSLNAREQARVHASSRRAVNILAMGKELDFGNVVNTNQKTAETNVAMPEYMQSPDVYVEWMETLPWANHSWSAGDQVQASQTYINMLDNNTKKAFLNKMFAFLDEKQSAVSGFWNDDISFNSLSGAFKLAIVYVQHGRTPKYLDTMLDSIWKVLDSEEFTTATYIRNPCELLSYLSRNFGYEQEVKETLPKYIDMFYNAVKAFHAPDGGFPSATGAALTVFGGVAAGTGGFEGDIDALMQVLHVRKIICNLLGYKIPMLSEYAKDFWDYITGKKEIPDTVDRDYKLEFKTNFDNLKVGAVTDENTPETWKFMGVDGISIEKDPWDSANKCLKITDNRADFMYHAYFPVKSLNRFTFEFRAMFEKDGSNTSYGSGFALYKKEVATNQELLMSFYQRQEGSAVNVFPSFDQKVTLSKLELDEWYWFKAEGEWSKDKNGEDTILTRYYIKGPFDEDYVHIKSADNIIYKYHQTVKWVDFYTGRESFDRIYIDDVSYITGY